MTNISVLEREKDVFKEELRLCQNSRSSSGASPVDFSSLTTKLDACIETRNQVNCPDCTCHGLLNDEKLLFSSIKTSLDKFDRSILASEDLKKINVKVLATIGLWNRLDAYLTELFKSLTQKCQIKEQTNAQKMCLDNCLSTKCPPMDRSLCPSSPATQTQEVCLKDCLATKCPPLDLSLCPSSIASQPHQVCLHDCLKTKCPPLDLALCPSSTSSQPHRMCLEDCLKTKCPPFDASLCPLISNEGHKTCLADCLKTKCPPLDLSHCPKCPPLDVSLCPSTSNETHRTCLADCLKTKCPPLNVSYCPKCPAIDLSLCPKPIAPMHHPVHNACLDACLKSKCPALDLSQCPNCPSCICLHKTLEASVDPSKERNSFDPKKYFPLDTDKDDLIDPSKPIHDNEKKESAEKPEHPRETLKRLLQQALNDSSLWTGTFLKKRMS